MHQALQIEAPNVDHISIQSDKMIPDNADLGKLSFRQNLEKPPYLSHFSKDKIS